MAAKKKTAKKKAAPKKKREPNVASGLQSAAHHLRRAVFSIGRTGTASHAKAAEEMVDSGGLLAKYRKDGPDGIMKRKKKKGKKKGKK